MNAPTPRPVQFTLDLLHRPAPSLENFIAGANAVALAALRDALAGRGPQFVHLWGPPGSGRSHLLEALARAGASAGGPGCVPSHAAGPGLYVVDDVDQLEDLEQAALFALQNEVRGTAGSRLVLNTLFSLGTNDVCH